MGGKERGQETVFRSGGEQEREKEARVVKAAGGRGDVHRCEQLSHTFCPVHYCN